MSSLPPNLINERDRRTEVARLLALGVWGLPFDVFPSFSPYRARVVMPVTSTFCSASSKS